MKTDKLKKLSRQTLKEMTGGGPIYSAQECNSSADCNSRYGEAFIMCPDGSGSMTGYICMGGRCVFGAGFCAEPEGPVRIP